MAQQASLKGQREAQALAVLRKLNHVAQRRPLQLCPRWWPPLRQVQIAVGDISPIPTALRPTLIVRTPERGVASAGRKGSENSRAGQTHRLAVMSVLDQFGDDPRPILEVALEQATPTRNRCR